MNRTILKWASMAAMVIAAAGQAGSASACMPFGGVDTGARGGGKNPEEQLSTGANMAWFEWSDAEEGFVPVQLWFDPYASQLPIQSDEVDATDWLREQGLLGGANGLACGGWDNGGGPRRLDQVVVRPLGNPEAFRPMRGFPGRISNTGGVGRLILSVVTGHWPTDVPVGADCDSEQADHQACLALRGTVGTALAIFRSWNFTAVFPDGSRTDYLAVSGILSECGIRVREGGRRCSSE